MGSINRLKKQKLFVDAAQRFLKSVNNSCISLFFGSHLLEGEKFNTSSAVLFLLIVLQALQNEVVYFTILTILCMIYIAQARNSFPKQILIIVFPLIMIFFLGLQGFADHHAYDSFKDAWYVIKPIIAIVLGYLIGTRFISVQNFFRVIVVASLALAICHLATVIYYSFQGLDLFHIRVGEQVPGYFMVSVGLGLLLYHWKDKQYIMANSTLYFIAAGLMVLSLAESLSRTWMLCLLIVVLALHGSFNNFGITTSVRAPGISGLAIMTMLAIISLSNLHDEKKFQNEITHSLSEVEIKNYNDLNGHWRGYESYRAFKAYQEGTLPQKIFGQGMGTLIDLGLNENLGGKVFRYVPILHNGYLYVLVKFGAIGFSLYLYFLFRMVLIKLPPRFGSESIKLGHIVVAIGWCLILTSVVISGIFNKSNMDSALIVAFAALALMNKLNPN